MMKKLTFLFSAILLIGILLIGCGKAEQQTEATVQNWSIKTEVDEFGDEVANGKKYIQTAFSGDFSNTATSSSELKGYLSMIPTEKELFAVSFKLLEYGDNPVTYFDSDISNGIVLKTKINNVVNEYYLVGNSPNGDLYLSDDDYYFYHDLVDNSGEMQCIITIGSSQYNFTIQTGNIKQVCEDAFGIFADGIQTMNQALTAFANRNMHGERYNYITAHMEEYPIVKNDELKDMFDDGYWMQIEVDNTVFDQWWVFEFKDGKRYQVFRIYDGTYESFEDNQFEQKVQIANDKVYVGNIDINEEPDEGSEYRKISEGYYIEKSISSYSGDANYNLYVACDKDGNPLHNPE